jgi:hypothetical protein
MPAGKQLRGRWRWQRCPRQAHALNVSSGRAARWSRTHMFDSTVDSLLNKRTKLGQRVRPAGRIPCSNHCRLYNLHTRLLAHTILTTSGYADVAGARKLGERTNPSTYEASRRGWSTPRLYPGRCSSARCARCWRSKRAAAAVAHHAVAAGCAGMPTMWTVAGFAGSPAYIQWAGFMQTNLFMPGVCMVH